jgi:hypothetical protein
VETVADCLAAQWNDIDLYQAYRDFTTDIINFPGDEVRAFIAELHAAGQHCARRSRLSSLSPLTAACASA